MIDLDRIRSIISSAPQDGDAATVTRGFLEAVVAEVSAGRAAKASLAIQAGVQTVIDSLAPGART